MDYDKFSEEIEPQIREVYTELYREHIRKMIENKDDIWEDKLGGCEIEDCYAGYSDAAAFPDMDITYDGEVIDTYSYNPDMEFEDLEEKFIICVKMGQNTEKDFEILIENLLDSIIIDMTHHYWWKLTGEQKGY